MQTFRFKFRIGDQKVESVTRGKNVIVSKSTCSLDMIKLNYT